jgi:hypothetical protein
VIASISNCLVVFGNPGIMIIDAVHPVWVLGGFEIRRPGANLSVILYEMPNIVLNCLGPVRGGPEGNTSIGEAETESNKYDQGVHWVHLRG